MSQTGKQNNGQGSNLNTQHGFQCATISNGGYCKSAQVAQKPNSTENVIVISGTSLLYAPNSAYIPPVSSAQIFSGMATSGAPVYISSAYISSAYSANALYQFASACRTRGGKYLAAGLLATNLAQGFILPYKAFAAVDVVWDGETSTGLSLNSGDRQYVSSGGTANNTTINTSGAQTIYNGGIANSAIINNKGEQNISSGGTANGTTISSGGNQYVITGATASNTTIYNGGDQFILSGGTANSTTINLGGSQSVSRGIANNTIVSQGGKQYVSSGGIANNTIVSDGSQFVSNGGIANGTIVSGGFQTVARGGIANNATISGGTQSVTSTGISNDSIILAGGRQNVTKSGIANRTIVSAGGIQLVYDSGITSGTILGGSQRVYANGITSGTIISAGNQHVSSGGVANGTIISGGNQNVSSGGIANNTTVSSGGNQNLSSGGIASNTTVSSGSWQRVYSGGTAYSTTILSGGMMLVDSAGGIAVNTILSGGTVRGSLEHTSGQSLQAAGGAIEENLSFNGGTFIPVLDATDTSANALIAGDVTGLATATIAPIWQNNQAGTGEASYTVLTASSIDSTFGTATELAKATYTQEIDNNKLLLHVKEKKAIFTEMAAQLSPNAQKLASVLDLVLDANNYDLGSLETAIGSLPDNPQVLSAAIDELIPTNISTIAGINTSALQNFIMQLPKASSGSLLAYIPNLYASNTATDDASNSISYENTQNNWQFFGTPFFYLASQDSSKGYDGYDVKLGGLNFGLLRSFNDMWLGFGMGYNYQALDMSGSSSEISGNQLLFSTFGGKTFNNLFVEASLGYAHTWNESTRNINIGTGPTAYNANIKGDFGQNSLFVNADLGYVYNLENGMRLIPSVGMAYTYTHTNSFSETGGTAALSIDSSSINSFQIPLSVTVEKAFALENLMLTPSAFISYRPELGDVQSTTKANFVNARAAGSFESQSLSSSRHTFALGAGAVAEFSNNIDLSVNYELELKDGFDSHYADLRFTWAF